LKAATLLSPLPWMILIFVLDWLLARRCDPQGRAEASIAATATKKG
jgi:hypothetical protein